jgi:thiol-disulfide isomerase/thioredoxin
MTESDLIKLATESGVLDEAASDELVLSDTFRSSVEKYKSMLEGSMTDDIVKELLDEVQHPSDFQSVVRDHPWILAEYIALADSSPLSHRQRLRLITIIDLFRTESEQEDHSPAAFIPIDGERLPFLTQIHQYSLVYIWLTDCPPCEVLRETLDELLQKPTEEILLLSVYGPASADTLKREYGVEAGPVLLFFRGEEVYMRLHGVSDPAVILDGLESLTKDN